MERRSLVWVWLLFRGRALGGGTGSVNCPCIVYSALDSHPEYVVDGQLVYSPGDGSAKYNYPLFYGNTECKAHDANLPPICDKASGRPEWCDEEWCYVERSTCDMTASRSNFFPLEKDLYYSYSTCQGERGSNSFDAWAQENLDGSTLLIPLLQGYVQASRTQVENAFVQSGGNAAEACSFSSTCPCDECETNADWGQKVDLAGVGVWQKSNNNLAGCLARAITYTYQKVAAKESDANGRRIGYQYFADQFSGSYVGWPNVDSCFDSSYDPRYRPWYAAGSSGPKDVVIVVDVSGSMGTASRESLAKRAAIAILDTLTWKDHASIVQFDNGVVGVFSELLVSVTSAQRDVMKRWVDRSDGARGGTDFKEALFGTDEGHPGAFTIIGNSVTAGKTSMCQKIIMFLTDGGAPFGDEDFKRVRDLSTQLDVIIFTYALGSGADTSVTKRLACENKGIFYPVADGANLPTIMADYYSYFVAGQQMCSASFVEYTDVITKTALLAGCLPMYNRMTSDASLLGVTCMDLNMIADMATLRNMSGWRDIVSKLSDMTKRCRPLQLSPCHLQKMRAAYSSESICSSGPTVSSNTKCPCVASGCKDDTSFIDEKGYFCDTWIGDDCSSAASDWGYSEAGMQELFRRCKQSCGQCAWQDPCPSSTASDCSSESTSVPETSRACMTDKVSGVDIEGCFMSCGDQSKDRYQAKRVCNTVASGSPRSLSHGPGAAIAAGLSAGFFVALATATLH